jgi:MinD-like ATPase involved in chromosome partitioning or flagellar assembly
VDDDPRQLAELALRGPAARAVPPVARVLPTPPAPPPSLPSPLPSPHRVFERMQAAERPQVLDPFELLARAEPVEPAGPNGPKPVIPVPQNPYARDTPAISRRTLLGDEARGATAVEQRPRPVVAATRSAIDPRQILDRLGQGRRAPVSAELGQAVLACKPLVAAVVSRKGGVGKTASAAAVAAILGEAVDPFGHTAALVDANVGNPDAWGRLDVRGNPPTMREIVRSVMAGREPPGPAFAETPALAVYPESREAGEGYAPAQIQRVASYLKGRHAAVVVDLPNRLPAFTSAEAAVAAAWIGEADVLVLPTTADPTALLGAIEYLDADTVQGKPVVVSYIVPRVRQIRDAPQVRGMLDRIRASVAALVEVPDDDRATLALVRRVAITEVSGELRNAYLNLATRVIEAAASRNGGGWS